MSKTTIKKQIPKPEAVVAALSDLAQAATGIYYSLIGGQALQAHGVPRMTLDADVLVADEQAFRAMAATLIRDFGWTPLRYNIKKGDYATSERVVVHTMDDPVLFDVGQQRKMIPLRAQTTDGEGLLVELILAQHPVEEAMVVEAIPTRHMGVLVPVAPLGGVLLVKTKADRIKDRAAIEQTAEHLPAETMKRAIRWARKYDKATAEDVEMLVLAVYARHPVPAAKRGRK